MRLERSERALADLDDIWWFIAQDSERAADQVVDRLVSAADRLADFPRMGLARADLAPNLRALRVESYIIFYSVAEPVVTVERVLHASRDSEAIRF